MGTDSFISPPSVATLTNPTSWPLSKAPMNPRLRARTPAKGRDMCPGHDRANSSLSFASSSIGFFSKETMRSVCIVPDIVNPRAQASVRSAEKLSGVGALRRSTPAEINVMISPTGNGSMNV